MSLIDTICSRRSIRKYTEEELPEGTEDLLLKAAFSAPTAKNKQPWHFVLINDRRILKEIAKRHPNASMMKDARLGILVCGDRTIEETEPYILQCCSAATENILLAAHSLGLGAVWLGVYPKEDRIESMERMFNLPESVIPVSLISLGIPAEKKQPRQNYNAGRVHSNRW